MLKLTRSRRSKTSKKGRSICPGKKPGYKCNRLKGCKTAKGKKRTFCRKKKTHRRKTMRRLK
jgi:hypothetical protein